MISPAAPFLAKLPPTWTTTRVKHLFAERDLRSKSGIEELFSLSKVRGLLPRSQVTDKEARADSLEGYKRFAAGDLVMNKMQAWNGVFGISMSHGGIVSPDYSVFSVVAEIDARFFTYLFKTDLYAGVFEQLARGMGTAFLRLNTDDFGGVDVPLPSKGEQTRIANFLDEQTARIDALIAEKELLLSTLTDWFSAELSRLCFGSDYPLIPIGNSWIPALPEGWRAMRLKHLISGIEQGWSPECEGRLADDDEWGVLKAGAANGGVYRQDEHKALPSHLEPMPDLEVKVGDVLVTRASGTHAYVGSFAYVYATRQRLMLSDKNFRLRFSNQPQLLPELLAWTCNSQNLREQVGQYVSGADGLAKNIGSGSLREVWLPVPPLTEQPRILAELRALRAKVEDLSQHVSRHVARLREYRSALISAAVTGQLSVT